MASQLVALVMFLMGAAGCSDELPPSAIYEPANCTPAVKLDVALEPEGGGAPTNESSRGAPAEASEEKPPAPLVKPRPPESGPDLIDLNAASEMELTRLPGVGPSLAQRIVEYRSKRPFKRVTDVKRVRGIGPAKFEKIKAMLTVR